MLCDDKSAPAACSIHRDQQHCDYRLLHSTIRTVDFAKQCHVTILTFPPHCSHKLQPLAHTVYGPFKRYYNNAADSWMLNHAVVNMVIYDLAQLVGSAFKSAMTPGNIVAGFRVSGIYPFNADIFGDCQVTHITGLVVHYNHIL